MQNQDCHSTSHSKYLCNYHFVWIPKYRKGILYLANLFKGVSVRKLGLKYPHLRRKEGIWTRAYFVSTHGHVSSETIKKYVEEQTKK